MDIVLIGAGNVATQIAKTFQKKYFDLSKFIAEH